MYVQEKEYGRVDKVYHCDHEGRMDDMGKLGADDTLKKSPGWCPLECNTDSDLIKMGLGMYFIDKYGNTIEVKVPESEYVPEIFFTKIGNNISF